MNRAPAVAGTFYPGQAEVLRERVQSLMDVKASARPAHAAIIPHAGYVYSGPVAGEVFARLEIPPTVVILNPNHTGAGRPFAVWPDGLWSTPLGDVPVDATLARELLESCSVLTAETRAHLREHSGEVMLPFLQVKRPDVSIVVVVVDMAPLETLQQLGRELASVLSAKDPRPLILASSDMTHFQSEQAARQQDDLAIQPMLRLDEEGLYSVVTGRHITMCGVAPVTVAMAAVKELGAERGELVRYDTSASASGDTSNVVGYAGLIFS